MMPMRQSAALYVTRNADASAKCNDISDLPSCTLIIFVQFHARADASGDPRWVLTVLQEESVQSCMLLCV